MKSWESYEEVAKHLLDSIANEFGVDSFDGKQKIAGLRSGTHWEIDAKGVKENSEGFIIVECRRYTTSKQNQERLGGLAYRIIDTGAESGIIVSPLGLQEGAEKVAKAENIINVILDENSTPNEFALEFLNKIFIGKTEQALMSDHTEAFHQRICRRCGLKFNE